MTRGNAQKRAPAREANASPAEKPTPTDIGGLPRQNFQDESAERLIYDRLRLGIMSALAVNELLTFTDLKALFDVTDGNLSAHARKLEDAGLIHCHKTFEARRPRTQYRLTPAGRHALERYLRHMEAVIHATRRGAPASNQDTVHALL